MRRIRDIAIVVFLLSRSIQAQTLTQLRVVETVPVPSLPSVPMMLPISSDSDGNIYARFSQKDASSPPIIKIGADGTVKAAFTVASAVQESPELKGIEADIYEYEIDPSGKLFALGFIKSSLCILKFTDSGAFDGKITIDSQGVSHIINQFLLLPHETFLLGGRIRVREGGVSHDKPFSGIYNSSGKLIREITLKDDLEPKTSKATPEDSDFRKAIDFSRSLVSPDGKIYLIRHESPAKVFVISVGGDLISTYSIKSPLDGGMPGSSKLSQGRLAVDFVKSNESGPDTKIIRVVSADTGDVLADYDYPSEPKTLGAWAGLNADGFIFLGSNKGQLTRYRLTSR